MTMPRILAIGGSDSGGGAGIEADIKTITALGGYAMTAITALTAQDTAAVYEIVPVAPDFVARCVALAIGDIGVDAVKLGMLGTAAVVDAIADALGSCSAPVVLDPVMVSTSGTILLAEDARVAMMRRLMPIAALITPNRAEAALMSGMAIETQADAVAAGQELRRRGAVAVLVKGGHFEGDVVTDLLVTAHDVRPFPMQRVMTRHTHGTGCTLASAIATHLGAGVGLEAAIEGAQGFLRMALVAAPGFAKGQGPMGHGAAMIAMGACKTGRPA